MKVSTADAWDTDVWQTVTVQLSAEFGCNTAVLYGITVSIKIEVSSETYVMTKGPYELTRKDSTKIVLFEFFFNSTELGLAEGEHVASDIYISVSFIDRVVCPFYWLGIPIDDKYSTAWFPMYSVMITRPSNSQPSVSIVSPVGVNAKGMTIINASVYDADSEIDHVQVKICDAPWLNMSASGSFYIYNWNSTELSDGLHTITVRAVDKIGNENTAAIYVNVKNEELEEQPNRPDYYTPCFLVKRCRSLLFGLGLIMILVIILFFIGKLPRKTITKHVAEKS